MLAVNAHLMLAVIPIIYRQCKGTTKFELYKEKEQFFRPVWLKLPNTP